MGVHCCCLHINYIVYKHFDRTLHVGSSNPTCVQNFRPVPLTVFEIQGFKLKNKNNDRRRIGEIDFLPYLSCLWSNSHQILVDIHIDLSYHPVVSKVDYH